ncbi:MAG TPA: DUF1145 domain-containing protein [Pseudomonas sabulinigri]|jgi:putative membrane protein|uniref:DUF1145 domain-containing protein n=1 Tax=marine sediment metagenome TaxID=412755 RepID=A0A0F9SJU8_9ZZZZ|nr:DUF1145 domain-containing protein [Halopseudomonas sabulinigri]HEC51657.1 DUF1145 domain-containing protein [Halopseudomonas sabulinigri]|tara:strand:- start:1327 stop:1602 length:276 start_codon:yes stop_codon:yes gene_type:complete
MRVVFLIGKLLTLAFWLLVILSLLGLVQVPNPQRLNWLALTIVLIHLVEWALVGKQLKKLGSPLKQFALVMLFGVFYVKAPDTRAAVNQAL